MSNPETLLTQPGRKRTTVKRRRFNWILSDWLRRGLTRWVEWTARMKGQRFYCRALAGESDYNITINCDLTVSCNCQDYDGSGHLGDLNKQPFRDVFFGPVAQRFRAELAEGRLPIKTCVRCCELQRIPKAGRAKTGSANVTPAPRLPHLGMLLENTVLCNLDCIGCDRGSAARTRSVMKMPLENMKRMAELVRELGLENVFYLNLGEPFLSPNIGLELRMLREQNPDCSIVISTNGIVLDTDAKREAAMQASFVYFSIAGVNEPMLRKYEKQGSFERAYKNIKDLAAYRAARGLSKPVIEWKYLLFNWNDRRKTIERAIEMAKAAGVDAISFWPTGNPFYGISYRYRLGFLNDVGVECWKGREVDLRPVEQAAAVPLWRPK
jgi:pyruvate-formate lyase-activating enzyme